MKKNNNESGFSVVEALLVVIILLLVGFIGYYVYHANSKTTDTYNAASDNVSPVVTTKKTTTSTDQQYLTIKEWSVKLPLTSDLNGAYYALKSGSNSAYLSLNQYKGTDCAADQVSLGLIQRFLATDKDDDGNTLLSDFPQAVKVGDWYYQYQHPQAGCNGTVDSSTVDSAAMAKTSALMADFKTAAAKLVAN
jgi:hypothetical protein